MGRRVHIIVNPISGSLTSRQDVHWLQQELLRRGEQVRLNLTKRVGDGQRLARSGRDFSELTVVFGGDGTVTEAVNGLAGTDVPILIVPTGKENLLARELGIRRGRKRLRELIDSTARRRLDVGQANRVHFTSIVGVGFDGQVIHRIHRIRRGHITYISYFWPIWRTFWEYRFPPLKVFADGESICEGPCLVFIGNIRRYAIALNILHQARCDDGLLDLCVYRCRSQYRLLWHAGCTAVRRHIKRQDVIYRRCRKIVVEGPSHVHWQRDGEFGGILPVKIQVNPAAVEMVVPEDRKTGTTKEHE